MTFRTLFLCILSNICLPAMAVNLQHVHDIIHGQQDAAYHETMRPAPDSLQSDRKQEILEESVITSYRKRKQVEGIMAGNLKLNAEAMTGLPRFLGTVDILKAIQLMPGVTASGEMDSGIYIRGGDPGQNLLMIDGATIYSPAHLLGFFSVFNSDHISSVSIYKSGIAARYGGCASGVIDVRTDDSVTEETEGVINLGIISSNATLKLPVGKKSQISVSGRGTYINYMLDAVGQAMRQGTDMPEYGFQDCNLTWITEFGKSNTLKINGYYGHDGLYFNHTGYNVLASMNWHNTAISATWDSHPEESLKNRHTVSFSRFSNHIGIEREAAYMRLPSDISDFAYKGKISTGFRQSRLDAGWNYTMHVSNVQHPLISGLNSFIDNTASRAPYHTHEFGIYADYSLWFGFPLSIDIGLRFSGAVTGNKAYAGPEPRIAVSYRPLPNMQIRAGAALQRQYINMVSISGMGMPTDFWTPVTSRIKPQISHSASVGFSHSLMEGVLEYSIEPYFSILDNVLEYDGELFDMINREYDTEKHIISGSGRNYGVEMMLKKNSGIINGWLSYTLSRSERSFPDIMNGAIFPSKHDRTHNLSAVANLEPDDRWTFSAVFVYATGSAYTPPIGIYILGENMIQEYGRHNSARMPDYHRLDISATYDFRPKGKCRHSLNLSFYNVYARENPLYLNIMFQMDRENNTLDMQIQNVSLYSIIPSLSYTLKF